MATALDRSAATQSVFPSRTTDYRAVLQFRNRICGGVPRDPKMIEGWLRTKAMISDQQELRHTMVRTLSEMGADVTSDMSMDELIEASQRVAADRHTQGFKRDRNGLYIEARQVQAMLKENTHIMFAGTKWGPTRKGAKNYLAEHVTVEPDRIYLGVEEPDGVEQTFAHTMGPDGPRASMTYVEYVEQPRIEFLVCVLKDAVSQEAWADIWPSAQQNGLGARRSQLEGKFYIVAWDKVS